MAQQFRRGLITNLLNPKAFVFYVAVVPAFLPPAPDLSGGYAVGTILEPRGGALSVVLDGCFAGPPVIAPSLDAALVARLQAGVWTALEAGEGDTGDPQGMELRFGTPTTEAIAGPSLQLQAGCEPLLAGLDPARLAGMTIVQEVLKAEIAEQRCDGEDRGRRKPRRKAAGEAPPEGCGERPREPVVVGYRAVPLAWVMGPGEARDRALALLSADPSALWPAAPPVVPAAASPLAGEAPASGGLVGMTYGIPMGLRYRYLFADGRVSMGIRAEIGLVMYSGPMPGGGLALELEHRRHPERRLGFLWQAGFWFPGGWWGGGAVVLGDTTGPRIELGAAAGPYAVIPRAAMGWIW
jgi:hypothetical protein